MRDHRSTWILALAVTFLFVACGGGGGGGGGGGSSDSAVGAEGGSVVSDDGRVTLEIPAGALTEEVDISVRHLTPAEFPGMLATLDPGSNDVYALEPDGLAFSQPVTVTVDTGVGARTGDHLEAPVDGLFLSSGGTHELLEATVVVDGEGDSVHLESEIGHFSYLTRTDGVLSLRVGPLPRLVDEENPFPVLDLTGTSAGGVSLVFNEGRYLDQSSGLAPPIEPDSLGIPVLPIPRRTVTEGTLIARLDRYECATVGDATFGASVRMELRGDQGPDNLYLFVGLGSRSEPIVRVRFFWRLTCEHDETEPPEATVQDLEVEEPEEASRANYQGDDVIVVPGSNGWVIVDPVSGARITDAGLTYMQDLTGAMLLRADGETALVTGGPSGGGIHRHSEESGFLGLLELIRIDHNLTDVDPFPDRTGGLLVDHSVGIVNLVLRTSDWVVTPLVETPTNGSGPIVSATADGPTATLWFVTDGEPGELWRIDLSDSESTPVKVGDLEDAPRRVRRFDDLVIATNFGSDSVSVARTGVGIVDGHSWTTGPLGIDLGRLPDGTVRLVVGGAEETRIYYGDLDATTGELIAGAFVDLPEECRGPGFPIFTDPDDPTLVFAPCTLTDNAALIPLPGSE